MMSEPRTPPLSEENIIEKLPRRAKIRKPKSSSSGSLKSNSASDCRSHGRKSHSKVNRKRNKNTSSSSSSSSSAQVRRSKRNKRKQRRRRQSSRDQSIHDDDSEPSMFKQLVAALDGRNRASHVHGSQNVIPEFNPQAKAQTMQEWLSKINESGHIYGWSEQQTIYYALPRLTGLAKRWYDGLTSVKYSWDEWQMKLLRAFPCEENYGDLLTEMLARKSRRNETLEEYYYDKIRLINRCHIEGLNAVDCLTHGVFDHNVRMNAQGLCFKEPEDVLTYFRKISTKREEASKNFVESRERNTTDRQKRFLPSETTAKKAVVITSQCYNCGEKGHFWQSCPKDLVRCGKCKRVGHNASKCDKASSYPNKMQTGTNRQSNISKIQCSSDPCDKYFKDVVINNHKVKGFIDLGSECTLLSDQITLDIKPDHASTVELPTLKGFANGSIKPMAQVKILLRVDNLQEEIVAYVVPHVMMPYDVSILIGQNLTESPGVRIYKTDTDLILFKANDEPLQINIERPTEIKGAAVVSVIAQGTQAGMNIYISSEACLKPGSEYIVVPGIYHFDKGRSNIVILGLSNTVKLQRGQLVARGVFIPHFLCDTKQVSNIQKKDQDSEKKQEQDRKEITLQDIHTDENLHSDIKDKLCMLLNRNRDCFAFSTAELGRTNLTEMHIKLNDDTPVTYRPYRLSAPERTKVKDMIEDLCANGIIRESESEYASPLIVVPKGNGDLRLCVDYRALNKKTRKDKYPMPLIEDQIDSLSGQHFFTTLDLTSGYHQIPVAEDSKHLTAFVTQDGHFEYNRIPFGLCNAPAVFQRLIHKVLNAKKIPGVLAYMDDIVISSQTIAEGMTKLRQVLEVLREAQLTLNLKKCNFFQTNIDYLGYEISSQGIKPGKKKTEAVASFKKPENAHEIRQFIGLASFFRRFVPSFATLARPLTRLTKSNEKWEWGETQDEAFNKIKQTLISRPVLAIYNPKFLTELHTDASQIGIGGILMQRESEKSPLRAVSYFSRQTTAEEQHFHSYELETLAVVMCLNRFRIYLLGIEFKIVTDCNAVRLTWTKRDLVPRIARWWLQAQDFDFTIEFRPGTQMRHVDALSRNPLEGVEVGVDASVSDCNVLRVTSTPTLDDLQSTDPQLVLIKCILNGNCDEAKNIKNDYTIKDGKIYKKVGDSLKWVVPLDARWKVCHMSHDECGHVGLEKTLDKMRQTYWFRHMTSFVKKYVRACIPCAYAKLPTGKKEGYLHPIPKTPLPFHSVHIDHLGPFVKSKSGNTYILGIIDGYTKFIILKAVRNTKSKTSIAVLRDVFGIFGAPKLLISDRGTSFTSHEFADFVRDLEIKHIKSAVAMPRANGQIERYNRTILASLIALTHGENEDKEWDTHLNTIQWSLNNTLNKGIGKTPSEIVFGKRTIQLAEGHLHDLRTDGPANEMTLDKVRIEASQTTASNQEKMEKRFNTKRRAARGYKEGDLVLVQKQLNNPGESNKLLSKYSGPYKVTKVLGLDRYEVSSIEGYSKRKYQNVYAADRIKPWISLNSNEEYNKSDSDSELD